MNVTVIVQLPPEVSVVPQLLEAMAYCVPVCNAMEVMFKLPVFVLLSVMVWAGEVELTAVMSKSKLLGAGNPQTVFPPSSVVLLTFGSSGVQYCPFMPEVGCQPSPWGSVHVVPGRNAMVLHAQTLVASIEDG